MDEPHRKQKRSPLLPLNARIDVRYGHRLLVRVPSLDGHRDRRCERFCGNRWSAWECALTAAARAGYRDEVDRVLARDVRIVPADIRAAALAALAAVEQAREGFEGPRALPHFHDPPSWAQPDLERMRAAAERATVDWRETRRGPLHLVASNRFAERELVLGVTRGGPRLFALRECGDIVLTGLVKQDSAIGQLIDWVDGRTDTPPSVGVASLDLREV